MSPGKALGPRRAGGAGTRRLIYVPIIHTQADMGRLARSVRRATVDRLGRGAWKRNVDAIGRLWAEIQRTVGGWKLAWGNVRLYQDGLPQCGREVEIVTALAKAGSPNHRLLLSLMGRGATLMGTESPDLLVQEYKLTRELLARKGAAAVAEAQPDARSRALLQRRDRYIARRINESLRTGEIGLLFLGMLHSPRPYLARDIEVSYPILRPPRQRRVT